MTMHPRTPVPDAEVVTFWRRSSSTARGVTAYGKPLASPGAGFASAEIASTEPSVLLLRSRSKIGAVLAAPASTVAARLVGRRTFGVTRDEVQIALKQGTDNKTIIDGILYCADGQTPNLQEPMCPCAALMASLPQCALAATLAYL